MKIVLRFSKIIFTLFIFSLAGFVDAQSSKWDEASSGNHSIRQLGPDFFEDIPMKKIEGARLVLFNSRAANEIGLDLPRNPKDLESWVLSRFALEVDQTKKSSLKMIATRYLDSKEKKPGEALGDGHAVWSGEIINTLPDGKLAYIDIILKGIGQTPLAWTNHDNPEHSDGLQTTNEAVHSYLMSEINWRNNLDSTIDLAVIEIPIKKIEKRSGEFTKCAITVRVGAQTRLAHLSYWADDYPHFKKIRDFVVKRDLGLKLDFEISTKHIQEYLEKLTDNLADEVARYFDLNAVHGSPTMGNRTTRGSTIDLGTFRYLDAHHIDYRYLVQKLSLGGEFGQVQQFKNYLDVLASFPFFEPNLPFVQGNSFLNFKKKIFFSGLNQRFDHVFQEQLTKHWFHRFGFSNKQISRITKRINQETFSLLKKISEANSYETFNLEKRQLKPALFELREILKSAIALRTEKPNDLDAITKLFIPSRKWSRTDHKQAEEFAQPFIRLVDQILAEQNLNSDEIQEVIARAKQIGQFRRPDLGMDFTNNYEVPIVENIKSGHSVEFNSGQALAAADVLIDSPLLRKESLNFGRMPRIAIYSGTFDPPHLGHKKIIDFVNIALDIDYFYIIINVESSHKKQVSSYLYRLEMAKKMFESIPNTIIGPKNLEVAFQNGDMPAVIQMLIENHPTAQIYQIMGDDSFIRYKEVRRENSDLVVNPKLTLVVNHRSSDKTSTIEPRMLGVNSILAINVIESDSLSSTNIRASIRNGIKPPEISEEVFAITQHYNLYNSTIKSCSKALDKK